MKQILYVEILETYINSHTPLKVKCRICGSEWMCKPMRLLHGARCQNCIKPHTSFMEQFILISFQKVIGKDAVESRNTTAIGLELDIYIPNYNFAIEPGTWLYHKKKASNTDLFKRQECQKNGIKLITIYDTYPTNLPPPFETDCYVFAGFLNEYGYYRLRRVREHLCRVTGQMPQEHQGSAVSSQQIVPIRTVGRIPSESNVEIQCGEIRVSFSGTVTADHLRTVLEVLRSC